METSVEEKLHIQFMREALSMGQIALEKCEIPVGCVIVDHYGGKHTIIARGSNQTNESRNGTRHAEIVAVESLFTSDAYKPRYDLDVGKGLLSDCDLYVTCEPCIMCAGALAWSQLGTLIYGATDERRGFARLKENILHPKTKIITNILKEDCEAILKKFFQQLRN